MTLPVVGAVLVLCVAAVTLAAQQVQLSAVAAQFARAEARGDTVGQQQLSALGYPVTVQRAYRSEALCITLTARPSPGLLAAVTITGQSCSLTSR